MRIRRNQISLDSDSSSSSSSNSKSQRRKQKRLDAICEKEYTRNHRSAVVVEVEPSTNLLENEEIRRSSRVRKAPVLLDVSPKPTVKRRRRNDSEGGDSSRKKDGFGEPSSGSGGWKTRLRSNASVHNASVELKENRKLFDDVDGFVGKAKSKRKKVEDNVYESEDAKSESGSGDDKKSESKEVGDQETRVLGSDDDKNDGELADGEVFLEKEDNLHAEIVTGDDCDMVVVDGSLTQISEKQDKMVDRLFDGDQENNSRDVETMNEHDNQVECENKGKVVCEKEGADHMDHIEASGHDPEKFYEGGSSTDKNNGSCDGGKRLTDMKSEVGKLKQHSPDMVGRKHVREGRRCSLCGRGTDGKPPKRLVADPTDSDNDAYGGSSSCEEGNYSVLDGFPDEPGWLGRLLGPIHDRFGIADVWVHQHCAVWSPEVYFAGLGCLKNVRAALSRGKALKCSRCGRPGATIGCRVDRCPKTYHLPCGRAVGCIFDHRKFLIACNDHRHLFEPHNNSNMQRLRRLKTKKLKLETRKLSHDAWKKDIEAEEKWLENCGEDEEFLRREGKRLHRDILRIAPVYIGGSATDNEKQYQGWESVAGLQDVIKCMKEVVLLPLLYPEFYSSMGITPPRGILLHGYPGTGKTHVVRALIGSCAQGDRRIAYFARKGADCLGKYVGDAERQLRLLFQVAEKSQPSIIFFDEIDGLAPCRTRQQDQTHNSVVSTLLALMDGIKSRGSVIVIGATNRPDAVDSALRRPGRFDREIYFPLPSVKDRAAILSLHTQSWPKPISGSLLKWISLRTSGFAGTDLQALCTQAAMIALKKNCPLSELMLNAEKKANSGVHLSLPPCVVEETDWLDALACAPPPCSRREAGMAANDVASSPLHTHLVPCLLQPLSYLIVSLHLDERVWLPPLLYKAAKLIKSVIVSSLGQRERPTDLWWSYLRDLVKEADVAVQIEESLSRAGLFASGSSFSNRDMLPDEYDDTGNKFELCKERYARGISSQNVSCLDKHSGFRVLITGHPKSGQRHIASCFLHGFVGCVEIQKVDLSTISQEGHGDIADGMNKILLRCSSKGLCVLYMPRIDLWAIDTHHQPDSGEDNIGDLADKQITASRIWNTFMDQVDSICLSASLMILATSEVTSEDLPLKISQFFSSNTFKSNNSTTSEQSMPRFVVQLDGSFDHDAMMNSSASQLSRDLVQQYVQFVHHRAHSVKINKSTAADVTENNVEFECEKTLSEKANGLTAPILARIVTDSGGTCLGKSTENKDTAVEIGHFQDTVPRSLCNIKTTKGKSNMLLAISSLGYQILQYPHFAELCWTTSKLKEGPYADINGPWKGWPFNSCIVRLSDSSEKVSLGQSSSNLRNKETSGVVRGLVAVGLLAYKGVYTSIREVSFEVRKVLELLVEQLNAKILDGKDRAQFFYLLSQVAYLEDMVNSWAYTLQSLECDASTLAKSSEVKNDQCRDDQRAPECNAIETNVCKPYIKEKSSDETEVLEESNNVGLNEGIGCRDELDFKAKIAPSEVSSQGTTSSAQSSPRSPPQTSAGDLDGSNALDTQSTVANAVPKSGKYMEVIHESFGFSQTSQSTPMEKSILISSTEMDKSATASDVNAQKFEELVENPSTKSNDDVVSVSPISRLTCLYSCCFDCMDLIYALIRKILTSEWKAIKSSWTVEDANEAISSWSTNFLSSLRKIYTVESDRKSELISENLGLCTCSDVDHKEANGNSRLESTEVLPAECNFHSTSKDAAENSNVITNSQCGVALKFCFMDNVLIASDLDKDVLSHCKFQNLCLNSLIQWILMIKQPLS